MLKKKFSPDIFFYVILALAVFLPRAFALDRFATTDEPEWLGQSGNFYYALGQREPAETYRREHPAVTTLWAGAAGYLTAIPEYRGWGQGYLETTRTESYLREKGVEPIDVLAAGRFFLVLATTILLTASFYFAQRLFGKEHALVGMLLAAFDPFHTALSRVLHIDSTLSNLILLTALAYMSYLYTGRRRVDLAAAGAAAGLTLMTKTPGLFLFPFIGLLAGVAYFQERCSRGSSSQWEGFKRAAVPFLAWALILGISFFVLWPAMWVKPLEVINDTFVKAVRYASGGHTKALFFNGHIFKDGSIGWDYFYYYPLTFLWRTTPIVMLGLIAALAGFFWRIPPVDDELTRKGLAGLFYLAFFYMAFMTLGLKKFDRYGLPAYLPLDLIAGVGLIALTARLREYIKRLQSQAAAAAFVLVLLLAQLAGTLRFFPYYFSYYNPVMGGTAKAPQVMLVGWGEILDQVGAYLNQQPGAQDSSAISCFQVGALSYFYDGTVVRPFEIFPEMEPKYINQLLEADYFVDYIQCRQLGDNVFWEQYQPMHMIEYRGIEYARIFDLSQITFPDYISASIDGTE